MAVSFVIADIIADVARRCNCPAFSASSNVTNGTVNYWLAQSARSWSALLQASQCEDNDLVTTATLNTVASFELVSLPPDCSDVHAVLWQKAADDYQLMKPAALDDLEGTSPPDKAWECAPRYRLEGNLLRLLPASTEAEKLTLFYTNHLVTTGETHLQSRLDADLWMTLDVAIKVLGAKNRDATALQAEKAVLEQNIKSSARRRDAYGPSTIRDVRSRGWRRAVRNTWGY